MFGSKLKNREIESSEAPGTPSSSKRFKRFRSRHHKVNSHSNNVSLDQQSLKEGMNGELGNFCDRFEITCDDVVTNGSGKMCGIA